MPASLVTEALLRCSLDYAGLVSITATVQNDTIKLPQGVHLPDGTPVRVEPLSDSPSETFAGRYAEFIGAIKGSRPDLSENLDHYLYGTPKRKS
jgi:hypothetical protein